MVKMKGVTMKKAFSFIGMVMGCIVAVLGVLLMLGVFGGDTGTASGSISLYDSGYAKFGADFYTYVTNNAYEAAVGARVTANNLHYIAELLKPALGIFLIGFGTGMLCLFAGKVGEPSKVTVYQEGIDQIIQKSVELALDSRKEMLAPPVEKEESIADELPVL